jgi:hypothetical protein
MVRCGVCKRGLYLKKHKYGWLYLCYHEGTVHEDAPCVSMVTRKLDPVVWGAAVRAVKDPAFFERILDTTDKVAGPEARARALSRQLEEAQKDQIILQKHLRRLDPDDPDDADLISSYELDLRGVLARIKEHQAALEAVQAEQRTEQARQATLSAFRDYAEAERPTLESKTPLDKHDLLRAMGVRVRLSGGDVPFVDRVWIVFDLRGLPGAAEWLHEDERERQGPRHIIDLSIEDEAQQLGQYVYEIQTTGQEDGGGGTIQASEEASAQAMPGVALERSRSGRSTANTSVATPSSKGFTLS